MNNINLLKDVYEVTRQLLQMSISDDKMAMLFDFRHFNDKIIYLKTREMNSIALLEMNHVFIMKAIMILRI